MIQERLAVSQSVRSRLRRFACPGEKGGISVAEKQEAQNEHRSCSTLGSGVEEGVSVEKR